MFGPYRTPEAPTSPQDDKPHDEALLGWTLAFLGGVRVCVALLTKESWGAEAVVAALMLPIGVHLLLRR